MRWSWLRRNRLQSPPPFLIGRGRALSFKRDRQKSGVSLVKLPSGGLGLENAKNARPPLPGAPLASGGGIPRLATWASILSQSGTRPLRKSRGSAQMIARNALGKIVGISRVKIVAHYTMDTPSERLDYSCVSIATALMCDARQEGAMQAAIPIPAKVIVITNHVIGSVTRRP